MNTATTDGRPLVLALVVAFLLLVGQVRAQSTPSETCAEQPTPAQEQTCLLGVLADTDAAVTSPAYVFLSEAGPVLGVLLAGFFGYRMGRGV